MIQKTGRYLLSVLLALALVLGLLPVMDLTAKAEDNVVFVTKGGTFYKEDIDFSKTYIFYLDSGQEYSLTIDARSVAQDPGPYLFVKNCSNSQAEQGWGVQTGNASFRSIWALYIRSDRSAVIDGAFKWPNGQGGYTGYPRHISGGNAWKLHFTSDGYTLESCKLKEPTYTVREVSLLCSDEAQPLLQASGESGPRHYRYKLDGTPWYEPGGQWSAWSTDVPTAQASGTYMVQWYSDFTEEWIGKGSEETPAQTVFTRIFDKAFPKPTLEGYSEPYDAESHSVTMTDVAEEGESEPVYYYRTSEDGNKWGEWFATAPTRTDVGVTYVQAYRRGDETHADSEVTDAVQIEINKADPTANAPTVPTMTYRNGQKLSEVALPNPEGNTEGTWSWNENPDLDTIGENQYSAKFTPRDTKNYNIVSDVKVTVTVDRADPTAFAPSALTAKYGQTLSALTLTNPNGNTPGAWTWKDTPETTVVGDTGEHSFEVVFTPEDGVHFKPASGSVTVTVERADPTAVAPAPTATYGQTLSAVTMTNPEDNTPGKWAWADSGETSVGAAGSHTFKASFEPEDKANYNSVSDVVVTLTVNKAEVTAPVIDSKEYNGQLQTAAVDENNALYDIVLNKGGTDVGEYQVVLALTDPANYRWEDGGKANKVLSFRITKTQAPVVEVPTPVAVTYNPDRTLANAPLPEGWAWTDNTVKPTVVNNGYAAALTVDDDNYDYTGVQGYDPDTHKVTRTLALTVNKAEVTAPFIVPKTYNGQPQTPDVPSTELFSVRIGNCVTVGEYGVVLTLADADNYKWTDSDEATNTLTFEIKKAIAPAVIVPYPDAVIYGPKSTLAKVDLPTGWAWTDDTIVPTVDNSGYPAALDVDDRNYDYTGEQGYDPDTHKVTRTVALTVYKAAQELVMGPMAKTPTYTGSAQELVSAGSAPDGEMQYALGTETKATQPYTTSIPTATDIGTYYVWYRVVGDDNHESTDELGPVEVALAPSPEFGEPDFILPEQLKVLDESAFEGVTSLTIVDAHNCTSIGKDAFKGTGLEQIRLPKDCEIDPEAFGEQRICVFAPAGGTTEAFCADYDNLVFIAEAE